MRITRLVLAFLLTAGLLPLPAAENLKFHHLTIEDGLSQNTVNAIAQDRTGYLWIGTQDGLNKYDGTGFVQYKTDPGNPDSLGENYVYCLAIDRHDVMWIGTRGRGLNRFDPKTGRFATFFYDPSNTDAVNDNFIFTLLADPDGTTLWVGTEQNGLNRFDTVRQTSTKFRHEAGRADSISGDRITALCRDASGSLWIGTRENGLNLFLEKEGRFLRFSHDPADPSSLSDDCVNTIREDRRGNLWIGTRNGLNRLDRGTRTFTVFRHDPANPSSLSHNRVTALHEDRSGRFWVGTEGGLNLFDRDRLTFSSWKEDAANRYSLSNNDIMNIFEDDNGTLWFGTFTGGLNKLLRPKFTHIERDPAAPSSLPQNSVWAICVDHEGMVWFGTESEGLCRWDRTTDTFTTFRNREDDPTSLSSNVVQAIFEDAQKTLWIGTDSGLNRFDRQTGRFTRFLDDLRVLASPDCRDIMKITGDRAGNLWLATYGGVCRFVPGTGSDPATFSYLVPAAGKNSLSHKRVRTVFQDSTGLFWFGTENGLNRYDAAAGRFDLFAHDPARPDSLSHNRVYSVFEDAQGTLWVCTKNGLNRFDRATGRCRLYSERDGLSNNTVYGVLADRQGALWMSTNNGLTRLDPATGQTRTFSVDDGLQSNEFNMGSFGQAPDGEMFFGGINGVNAFHPDRITYNTRPPPVVLTTFRKLDKVVMTARELADCPELHLSYRDNFFSFEFAALDFVAPARNRYAYKMEGFDADWIPCASRRYAAYTNLSGGRFVFRVKASNNDGVWNETGTAIALVIPPPPWKTWWAYGLYVTAVLGSFSAYVAWKKAQHAREMAFQKRLNDAANRFVPHEFLALLGKPDILEVGLGDQVQKEMSIFFSDIRSFTNISEKLSPRENIDFINAYLGRVGPVIREHHGFIDKYIGDAVMALFHTSPDDAVRAAVASLQAVDRFNEDRRQEHQEPIRIGIGINTGTLMLGTVGERDRLNATVISDAVNLASRIEGQTKAYGAGILITDATLERLGRRGDFLIRPVDRIAVKGKDRAVAIHEVFSGAPAPELEYKSAILDCYLEAITLYYQRKFAEAGRLFEACLRPGIEDKCVRMYLERCRFYTASPPPPDWDGVTRLTSK